MKLMLLCSNNSINWGDVASWVQAAIYLATLIVLGIQLYHLRKQTQVQTDSYKYSDYIRCQMDFGQTMRELLRANLHDTIYTSLYTKGKSKFNHKWTDYTDEDKKVYAFFEILYELFERVYCIKANDKENKIVDDNEWNYWISWIDDVKYHPIFNDIYWDSKGMFDKDFELLIESKLKEAGNLKAKSDNE